MLNSRLESFWCGLVAVENLAGVKFASVRSRNKREIGLKIADLKEGIKPPEDLVKFEKDRIALCEVHSDKDKDGKSVLVGGSYKFSNHKKVERVFDKLKKKYNSTIEAREKQEKEYNKLRDEESDVEIKMVAERDVPKAITGKQFEDIMEMIRDPK